MSSYHISNLGSFSRGVPSDLDGYTHTTIDAWMRARVDLGTEKISYADRLDWARVQAETAREALKEAEGRIGAWRNKGSFKRGNQAARKAAAPLGGYVHVRCTHEEKKEWQALAKIEGISLSDLIRKKLNNRP